jgi:hypothetical protein
MLTGGTTLHSTSRAGAAHTVQCKVQDKKNAVEMEMRRKKKRASTSRTRISSHRPPACVPLPAFPPLLAFHLFSPVGPPCVCVCFLRLFPGAASWPPPPPPPPHARRIVERDMSKATGARAQPTSSFFTFLPSSTRTTLHLQASTHLLQATAATIFDSSSSFCPRFGDPQTAAALINLLGVQSAMRFRLLMGSSTCVH